MRSALCTEPLWGIIGSVMNNYAQNFPHYDMTALLLKLSYYIQYYV